MKTIYLIAFCLLANVAFSQNSVELENGKIIIGKIITTDDKTISIVTADSVLYKIHMSEVKKIDGKRDILATYSVDNLTAGDELIKASKTYYSGIGISLAGIAGSVIGTSLYKPDDNDTDEQLTWKQNTTRTFQVIGFGLAGVGAIIQISAFSHVGKAGHKLNAMVSSNGIGLSYKF